MKFWLVLALGVAPMAHSQEAFQGLRWGANEQEITEKFGALDHQCNADEREIDKASPTRFCNGPIVKSYPVAGIPFELSFGLGKSNGRLQTVSLFHVENDKDRAQEQFDTIRALLTNKYGKARTSHDNKYARTSRRVVETWMPDRNVITLTWSGSGEGDDYYATLQVRYEQLGGGEQDKL